MLIEQMFVVYDFVIFVRNLLSLPVVPSRRVKMKKRGTNAYLS